MTPRLQHVVCQAAALRWLRWAGALVVHPSRDFSSSSTTTPPSWAVLFWTPFPSAAVPCVACALRGWVCPRRCTPLGVRSVCICLPALSNALKYESRWDGSSIHRIWHLRSMQSAGGCGLISPVTRGARHKVSGWEDGLLGIEQACAPSLSIVHPSPSAAAIAPHNTGDPLSPECACARTFSRNRAPQAAVADGESAWR